MLLRILSLALIAFVLAANVAAQSAANNEPRKRSGDEKDDSASESMLEMRYKWRIKAAEKEYKEIITRTDEIASLTDGLKEAFEKTERLAASDAGKLTALEKLLKKVRKNLGGDDDDDETDYGYAAPASLKDALERLDEAGKTLNAELKETTRHELSANSIENINTMLRLVGDIRRLSGNPDTK